MAETPQNIAISAPQLPILSQGLEYRFDPATGQYTVVQAVQVEGHKSELQAAEEAFLGITNIPQALAFGAIGIAFIALVVVPLAQNRLHKPKQEERDQKLEHINQSVNGFSNGKKLSENIEDLTATMEHQTELLEKIARKARIKV